MTIEELKTYKRILILGYGLEGEATEFFLKKNYPDAIIGVADKKDGDDYLSRQFQYDLVIKTPSIPRTVMKVPYTTATNIFFGNCQNL